MDTQWTTNGHPMDTLWTLWTNGSKPQVREMDNLPQVMDNLWTKHPLLDRGFVHWATIGDSK